MILARLASPAVAAYAIKGANALAAFVATALLARIAGPAVVGDYGFSVLTGTLLALVALRGLDQIVLKVIAGDLRIGDTAAAQGALAYTTRTVLIASLALTLAFLAAVAFAPIATMLEVNRGALLAAGLGIVSTTLFRLGLSIIRAASRPVAGQFYEGLNSFLFAGLITLLYVTGQVPNAAAAVIAFFACQLASTACVWVLIRRDARSWAPPASVDRTAITRAGLPIMVARGLDMFADWLLLALIAGAASTAEVGAMRVAMQVIMIMFIVVSTGENFLAARVAGDIRAGESARVWRRHRRVTLTMAAVLGPMVLACLLFPGQIMGLAFGPAFAVAGPALAIMTLGQATKIVTGPVGSMLTMGGMERPILVIAVASLAMTALLAWLLIPFWGIAGAAVAHAVATAFRNIASYVMARIHVPR
ncbi:lipopolysaccharide biosynthesis protein [Polymorphobacter sp.]|uniref:lipopolysaccharide biosynthesis protein n=1 Tax=Polymorphobacter sp. TaxID=1909290 RepID=UPI003F719D0E